MPEPIAPTHESDASPRGGLTVPALAFATGAVTTTEFIVIGLMPQLAEDLGIALHSAGWLITAFAIAAALAGPVVTLIAARWPPRVVLVSMLAIFGLGSLIAVAIPSFGVMIAVRVIQGAILTAYVSLASSTAVAAAPVGRGGRAVGHVNLGTVIGIVIAVPAGVAMAEALGWRAVYIGLGVVTLAAAPCLLRIMGPARQQGAALPRGQAGIVGRPRFLGHLLLSALLFTAMFSAYSYIAGFLQAVLGLSGSGVAAALLGFGVAGIIGNWLASRAVDREPARLTAVVTLILVLATAGAYLTRGSPVPAALVLAVWGGAHMAAFVACQVRVMFAAPDAQAFAASLNISVCNLGIGAGTLLGGWVATTFGITTVVLGAALVGLGAFALGVLLCLAPSGGGTWTARRHPNLR